MINSLFILIILSNIVIIRSQSNEINNQCLDCICKATGKCQTYNFGCSNVDSAYYCGAYQISYAYWADAGKLGDSGNKHDFEECLNTKDCAEQTIRNYMRKYGQDCNGDGLIDCKDFAILHKTGYRQCQQSAIENTKYWNVFTSTQCYQQSGNRNQAINRNSQANHNVRNVFTSSSSSSSSTIRNVRRTITSGNHNERNTDLRPFNRNLFKETENTHHISFPTAFDNFDSLNVNHNTNLNANHNSNHNFNHDNLNPNLRNLHNNHNELAIETSSRVARPVAAVRINLLNNNNFVNNNRKPLNSIKPIPARINNDQPPAIPRINESPTFSRNNEPSNSARVIRVNGNVRQPNINSNTDNNFDSKLSNATVTIDGRCLSCICFGSTKCNLKMKCSGSFCGSFLISHSYWREGGELMDNYVNCANDFNCAKQTVANYMARYNRDCDLNQELTCDDFAIIHQTGGFECEKNAKQIKKSHFFMNYAKCYYNDDFRVFTNDDEPVVGYSIIPAIPNSVPANRPVNNPPNNLPAIPNQPPNNLPVNSNRPINPRNRPNQPPNLIPEINLTNDWRPIEPLNNFNSRPSSVQPINNNLNTRPNNRPIIVSNDRPDWIENSENNEASNENSNNNNVNNDAPINENGNFNNNNNNDNNQPSNRSTRRKPLNGLNRPPPRAFENQPLNNKPIIEEEVSEQPDVEPPSNNFNAYSPMNVSHTNPINGNQFQPEVVPIENNRRTSPRSVSNVIPVEPNNYVRSFPKNNLTISQSCLDCICTATTSSTVCNDKGRCFVNSFGEFVCGPYQINRFFWVNSGIQNSGEPDAFEQCASDRICSQQIIGSYINKYSIDCNQDGIVDCLDFATMVKVGYKACSLQNLIDSNYWTEFEQCYGFGDD